MCSAKAEEILSETPKNTSKAPLAEIDGLPMRKGTLIDWFRFVPFAVVIFFVCCLADLRFRLARPFGMPALERVARWLNISIIFCLKTLLGMKLEIRGQKSLTTDSPYIIVCNHQSMFDISVIHGCFYQLRPRFIAKVELSKWLPAVSICLRTEGAAIINRSDSKQAIKEIKAFAARAKQFRFAPVIFPEGTRSRKGSMRQFKPGGFSTLVQNMPGAKIIPAAIDGSWKFSARRRGPMPFGNLVQFWIGEPISTKNKETSQLLSESYEAVSGMLHEMRLQNPEYQAKIPSQNTKPEYQ